MYNIIAIPNVLYFETFRARHFRKYSSVKIKKSDRSLPPSFCKVFSRFPYTQYDVRNITYKRVAWAIGLPSSLTTHVSVDEDIVILHTPGPLCACIMCLCCFNWPNVTSSTFRTRVVHATRAAAAARRRESEWDGETTTTTTRVYIHVYT